MGAHHQPLRSGAQPRPDQVSRGSTTARDDDTHPTPVGRSWSWTPPPLKTSALSLQVTRKFPTCQQRARQQAAEQQPHRHLELHASPRVQTPEDRGARRPSYCLRGRPQSKQRSAMLSKGSSVRFQFPRSVNKLSAGRGRKVSAHEDCVRAGWKK